VIAEFGLGPAVACRSGLAIRSFWNLTTLDLGVRTDHILPRSCNLKPRGLSNRFATITGFLQASKQFRASTVYGASEHLPLDSMHAEMPSYIAGQPAY